MLIIYHLLHRCTKSARNWIAVVWPLFSWVFGGFNSAFWKTFRFRLVENSCLKKACFSMAKHVNSALCCTFLSQTKKHFDFVHQVFCSPDLENNLNCHPMDFVVWQPGHRNDTTHHYIFFRRFYGCFASFPHIFIHFEVVFNSRQFWYHLFNII